MNIIAVSRCTIFYIDRFGFLLEIEKDGVIAPDNDPPQAMGDESLEVMHLYFICVSNISAEL